MKNSVISACADTFGYQGCHPTCLGKKHIQANYTSQFNEQKKCKSSQQLIKLLETVIAFFQVLPK